MSADARFSRRRRGFARVGLVRLGLMRAATAFALALLPGVSASAQLPERLPVAGSLVYNAIIYDRAQGTEGRYYGFRFAGRLAVPVARDTYVGAAVGSWVRPIAANCAIYSGCDHTLGAQSEAVVHQVYLQQYVVRHRGFVRAGAGLANTLTLQAGPFVMNSMEHWRPAVSTGIGVDLRLARFLYLTPSLDFTVLPGTDVARGELRGGLAPGLALTLR